MDTRVWGFRVGNFIKDSSSGWNYSIRFNKLKNLIEELDDKKLHQQVETLAIVAHGDANGLVQLEKDLTASTLPSFGNEFNDLSKFIKPHGKLIFMSCLAGGGKDGDELLIGISKYLSNVHIVGFTISGGLSQEGLPTLPGQVLEAENFIRGMPAKLMKGLPIMTEYSYHSKWAFNGYIEKIPIIEQVAKPGYKCAWSACPGHASAKDRCVPAIKGAKQQRKSYP